MNLALFPLHTVLCPGIALPLHIFEPRYRLMVQRCLASDAPFGVVWIREGREVGSGDLAVASVGTMAEIREADRHVDGRFDLVTIGTRRFRLEEAFTDREPYLVGRVEPIDEIVLDEARAGRLARLVTRRFVRYVDEVRDLAVQDDDADEPAEDVEDAAGPAAPEAPAAADADADAEATDVEAAKAVDADAADAGASDPQPSEGGAAHTDPAEMSIAEAPATVDPVLDEDAGATSLAIPADPTLLSHLLSGIVELDLPRRQALLEAPTTEARLASLAAVLAREVAYLRQGLRVFTPPGRTDGARRN